MKEARHKMTYCTFWLCKILDNANQSITVTQGRSVLACGLQKVQGTFLWREMSCILIVTVVSQVDATVKAHQNVRFK